MQYIHLLCHFSHDYSIINNGTENIHARTGSCIETNNLAVFKQLRVDSAYTSRTP